MSPIIDMGAPAEGGSSFGVVSQRRTRVMLCIVRAVLVLVFLLVSACHPAPRPSGEDGGPTDAGHDRDGDVDEDSGIDQDADVPGAGSLRLLLRVRVDGSVVEEPGEVAIPIGRLTRFDLGVARLAFEGDRPGDPELLNAGLLSPLAGERSATVAPAAPGLYSGVDMALRADSWGHALDVEITGLSEPRSIVLDVPLNIELRCAGGNLDLGVDERLELPLYLEAGELDEEFAELSAADLPSALMDKLVLACDEARSY
ncbi:hypothetical protein GW813_00070 [bacterium]|nr:hypothetical protein [bacterium]